MLSSVISKIILRSIILTMVSSIVLSAQTPYKVLNYFYSISGQYTIAGQQGSGYMSEIADVAGRYPGVWGEDFSFVIDGVFGGNTIAESRRRMIEEAKVRWARGEVISLMFHACPPTKAEPCDWFNDILSHLSDEQWSQLITPGTTLYNNWISRLDKIAVGLQELEDHGVEVLFRPFHEMNQGAFWWGGRPGPQGTAEIYRITHNYLTQTKGLSNIIWVWNVQDFASLATDVNDYDPGSAYWDMLTLDVYWSDGTGLTTAKYNIIKNKAGDKPFGLGELDALPNPDLLESQPQWTYFIAWRELTRQKNSDSYIAQVYNADNVLTRDELPGWDNYCPYNLDPIVIPGTIEAEDFNSCGEGESFHDSDTINAGSGYRVDSGVDIEECSAGGFNITDIKSGEWLTYSVNIQTNGAYKFELSVAAADTGKTFHLEINDADISGPVKIPNTGGLQSWQTVTFTSSPLTPGYRILKIFMDSDDFNLDKISVSLSNKAPDVKITSPKTGAAYYYPTDISITADANDEDGEISKMEFYGDSGKLGETNDAPFSYTWQEVSKGEHSVYAVATDDGGISTTSAPVIFEVKEQRGPFNGIAAEIPGRVEMENFDLGGQGISYNDITAGNKFNTYRGEDVDIEVCTDSTGGYSLGDFQQGEWVNYSINVTESGLFDLVLRVATQSTAAKIYILIGTSVNTGTINIPNTGAWQSWTNLLVPGVKLNAGETLMRIACQTEFPNINYIDFVPASTSALPALQHLPKQYALFQNYPNPFNPQTTIYYELPERTHVKLKIFDVNGRAIETLVNGDQSAGGYSVKFWADDLPSGIYVYKMETSAGFKKYQKMVVVK